VSDKPERGSITPVVGLVSGNQLQGTYRSVDELEGRAQGPATGLGRLDETTKLEFTDLQGRAELDPDFQPSRQEDADVRRAAAFEQRRQPCLTAKADTGGARVVPVSGGRLVRAQPIGQQRVSPGHRRKVGAGTLTIEQGGGEEVSIPNIIVARFGRRWARFVGGCFALPTAAGIPGCRHTGA